ncbi:hypothetical protein SCH01S_53_00510 [Sphingomonas changbaiensis NBRC 104936]|uniref:Uncharacterized protein n=1 Tax=Sphingomonas changbaiensis NBRC 104936 TaxID=1219043 RepID=A0A0E9MTU2_9SPHN|nr:hypothetical protein [Sphingomonas changbaiensis]GAO40979.1 hypothetical protein SCH01S_53_00510 [Sphingomonas changbaiensis NBRC 104936]
MPDLDRNNIYQLGAFDADEMLHEIVELRTRIMTAWRERGVMLTRDEQRRLLDEIRETCRLLGDLTH